MRVPIDHDSKKNPIVHCKLCGHDECCIWIPEVNDKLVKNEMCFTCDYWEERGQALANSQGKQFPHAVVVNNPEDGGPMVYMVAGEMPQSFGLMRGYGGERFIIDFDDGRKMASSNLWSGQKIPALWSKDPRFQPTARLRTRGQNPGPFLEEFKILIDKGLYFSEEA